MTKTCTECKLEKSLDDFHKHPANKDKRQGKCKKCCLHIRNTKGKAKQLRIRYGITLEEYEAKYKEQEGRCAICGIHHSDLGATFHVDHCHTTNTNRGLLCFNCNMGLGRFKDNIELLKKATEYLSVHKTAVRKVSS